MTRAQKSGKGESRLSGCSVGMLRNRQYAKAGGFLKGKGAGRTHVRPVERLMPARNAETVAEVSGAR